MSIIYKIKKLFESDNERTKNVKKNIVGSFMIRLTSIIVSLLLVPVTLGFASKEMYGIWLILSSIMIWLGFFDVGFTLGLKNRLTTAIALEQWERGKALVSTTYIMMILIFVPLCCILELIVPLVDWANFLNVSHIYNQEIINTMHVLVAFFCVQMIVNVLTAVIAAFQKVALSSLFPVIGNVLSLITIWILSQICKPSLLLLALSISLMPVVVLLVASFFLYQGKYKKISPSWKFFNPSYTKDLFSLGVKFFLIKIQAIVLYQCTNVLISNVSGPEEVTIYNIAYKYMNVAMMGFAIVLNPLWPAFTDAYTKKDYTWMRRVYKSMTKFYLLFSLLMALMLVLSPIVYNIWIGDKVEVPFIMTSLVCLYMLVHNWDSLQVNLINGIGTIKLQTYVTLIGLMLHVPLSFYFGKNIGLGAMGVVFSMIVINIIYSSFFTVQINKLLNNKAKGIWQK